MSESAMISVKRMRHSPRKYIKIYLRCGQCGYVRLGINNTHEQNQLFNEAHEALVQCAYTYPSDLYEGVL